MMNEPLSAIMTRQVVTVGPEDKLSKVKEILFSRRFHHVPVVEGPNNKLLGIVTTYDLVKVNSTFEGMDDIIVKDVMTTKLATLQPQEKIGAAAQIFLRDLFHGVPIINDDRELLGIVTVHDILGYSYYKAYPDDDFAVQYKSGSDK